MARCQEGMGLCMASRPAGDTGSNLLPIPSVHYRITKRWPATNTPEPAALAAN